MNRVHIQREEYETFAANSRERRLEWFRKARFGMFVHYGAFSSLGAGEWCMYFDNYKKSEYEEIANTFAPKEGCTDEWCALAKRAGAKYCVMTTRHHEGFSFGNRMQIHTIHIMSAAEILSQNLLPHAESMGSGSDFIPLLWIGTIRTAGVAHLTPRRVADFLIT